MNDTNTELLAEIKHLQSENIKLSNKLSFFYDDTTLRLMMQLTFINILWIMYGFIIEDTRIATIAIIGLGFNSLMIALFVNFIVHRHL